MGLDAYSGQHSHTLPCAAVGFLGMVVPCGANARKFVVVEFTKIVKR